MAKEKKSNWHHDHEAKAAALAKEIDALREKAGIAEEVEQFTDQSELRDHYFAVPDKDLRRQLIKKERKLNDLSVEWY